MIGLKAYSHGTSKYVYFYLNNSPKLIDVSWPCVYDLHVAGVSEKRSDKSKRF